MEAYVARKQAEADARRKKAPKKKSPKKPDPAQDTQRAKKRAEQRAKKKVDAQAVPAK